jgi:hypothetical protein
VRDGDAFELRVGKEFFHQLAKAQIECLRAAAGIGEQDAAAIEVLP